MVLAISPNGVELYFTYFAWYDIRQCRTFWLIQRRQKLEFCYSGNLIFHFAILDLVSARVTVRQDSARVFCGRNLAELLRIHFEECRQ